MPMRSRHSEGHRNRLLFRDAGSLTGKHEVFVVIISRCLWCSVLHGAKGSRISPIVHHVAQPKIAGWSLEAFFSLRDGVLKLRSRNDSGPQSSHVGGPWVVPSVILVSLTEVSQYNQMSSKEVSMNWVFCLVQVSCVVCKDILGTCSLQSIRISHRMSQKTHLVTSKNKHLSNRIHELWKLTTVPQCCVRH